MTDFTKYCRVYQTWNLVKKQETLPYSTRNDAVDKDASSDPLQASSLVELRHKVQMARVEKGLSIHDLSLLLNCDPEMMSSFERGDDILPDNVHNAIQKLLFSSPHSKNPNKKQKT